MNLESVPAYMLTNSSYICTKKCKMIEKLMYVVPTWPEHEQYQEILWQFLFVNAENSKSETISVI